MNKNKVYKTPKPDLQHIVLQAMAFTLTGYDYDTIRVIYELNDLRLSPIENVAKKWIDYGWVKGEYIKRYSYNTISVSPIRWAEIVRSIEPEQVHDLSLLPTKNNQYVSELVTGFVRAFIDFAHGKPYEEQVRKLDWSEAMVSDNLLMQVVHQMARQPENAAFLKYVDTDMLISIYYRLFLNDWMDLEPLRHLEVLKPVFWENEQLDESYRTAFYDGYLYNVEFLQTGKLREILEKLKSNSFYSKKLKAIGLLHEGNYAAALQEYSEMLKMVKTDRFSEPLTNFAYAIALAQTKTPQATKIAEKLMKSRIAIADPVCYAMLLALHHFFRGDAADFFLLNPLTHYHNRMTKCLVTLFLKHYQVFDRDILSMNTIEDQVVKREFDYLRLLFSQDFEKLTPMADKLKEQTGIAGPLLPVVRKKQRWELIIDQVMKMNTPKTGTTQHDELYRVAYTVDLSYYNVQPKLQKSKDGGITWSKGRNISLKTFKSGGEKCMTPQDHRVATLVKVYEYGWYSNESYILSGPQVIAALVGCPNVFSDSTGQHLDIVEEPLQLEVRTSGKGFVVKSNVNLNNIEDGVVIMQMGGKQLSVIRVSANQKKTLEVLSEIETFPKDSQEQLTGMLQSLSQNFTVMSPLLKNATELKRIEANALIAVQIAPVEDQMFNITLAVKPFGSCPPYQRPGKGMEIVSTTIDGERVQTERNLDAERRHLKVLRQKLSIFDRDLTDEDEWCLDTEDCLNLLECLRTASDICFVEWPQGAKMRVVRPMINAGQLKLKISSAGQWFELEGDLQIDNKEKMKMAELLEKLRVASGNFIRLSDDEYVALSEQLRRQLQAIDKMTTGRGKELKIAAMNAMQLANLEDMGAKLKADEPFRQLIKRIEEAGQQQFPLPSNIHAELRPYQVTGYQWMSRLAYWGAGACLADDMGLGKTLQAITLMQSRATMGPQLVIMPTSTREPPSNHR